MEENSKKYCLLTNDVETTSIWFNILRPETGYKVYKEGMPALLDLYAQYNIKSTFFFCGDIVRLYPDVVKIILPYGHEVASHGWSHEINETFDVMPLKKQIEHLKISKKTLEDLSGQEVITFRAPALRVNQFTPQALIQSGFKIDSSIPSQRFDFFLSFGSFKKLKWLTAPRLSYITSINDLTKKGNNGLIEIPLSATFIPYVSTTMRILPGVTKLQSSLLDIEQRINGKPIVFDIHPNEFIDESSETRVVNRRASNYLTYLLADLLRSKLKVKNLGKNAIKLYGNLIEYYYKKGYIFVTLKEYSNSLMV